MVDLNNLLVCRNLLKYKEELTSNSMESTSKMIAKAEELGLSGNVICEYLLYLLTHEPNLVSATVELNGGKIGASLKDFFITDIINLWSLFNDESNSVLVGYKPTKPINHTRLKLSADPTSMADSLIDYYRRYGCGEIADYCAFRWSGKLIGIKHFEDIHLSDLIGYDHQKLQLTGNTEAFVEGKPANNVLLVGARGTGKSSSVKALANEYFSKGLRLLQITKPQLKNLPEIMETLRSYASKRFIVFLDDLSFEESDPEYKYLKSAIEGGVEARPENVLIYATSNRRHLIRETWRDRVDGQDELYRDDSVNETISLSDRFGLIIYYYSPSQAEYLEIIRHMLKKQNIELDDEQLRIEGLRWEMTHSGRNGRTAQQFVTNYLGQRLS